MTINPNAEARREQHRQDSGQFGAHAFSMPETALTPEHEALNHSIYVIGADQGRAHSQYVQNALHELGTDVRAQHPDAEQLIFEFNLEHGDLQLVDIRGGDGEHIPHDIYFGVSDIADESDAQRFGWTLDEDGMYLEMSVADLPQLDETRLQAEGNVAAGLNGKDDAVATRQMLNLTMDNGLDPELVKNMSPEQLEEVRGILAETSKSIANYIVHSSQDEAA